MNNRVLVVSFAVICSFLILGVAVYATLRLQDTAPCINSALVVPDDFPTISDAVGNATEGDTIFVKKGTYEISEYSVEINKTLSINGEDQANTILVFPPDTRTGYELLISKVGFRVNADNFKISNLTIMNCDFGVSVFGNGTEVSNTIMDGIWLIGSYSKIFDNNITDALTENNSYTNFFTITGSYNNISRNSLDNIVDNECQGSFNKITENTIKGDLELKGSSNTITNNSFRTLSLRAADSNIIQNNTFNQLSLYNSSNNNIFANTALGPGHSGILMSSGSDNVFYGNCIADYSSVSTSTGRHSGQGVSIGSKATNNLFYHNNFANNYMNLMYNWNPEMSNINYWDNGTVGNYWSDYDGIDDDGDGIGDTPHSICYKNVDHYPLMLPFNIESLNTEFPDEVFR
ncbi:right-handed parallel beta-helix repeat-containing protein [Candidatus Bathyarchaeota archaeon]|nr:right-handed parallel beta-helix repeat-containing protein [Candidatus Bathyarchaeota archaeon]